MQNVCVCVWVLSKDCVGVYMCFEFLSYSMHARTTNKPKPYTHLTLKHAQKTLAFSNTCGLMVGFRASACPQVVQMLRSLCAAGSVGRWDHCNTEPCALSQTHNIKCSYGFDTVRLGIPPAKQWVFFLLHGRSSRAANQRCVCVCVSVCLYTELTHTSARAQNTTPNAKTQNTLKRTATHLLIRSFIRRTAATHTNGHSTLGIQVNFCIYSTLRDIYIICIIHVECDDDDDDCMKSACCACASWLSALRCYSQTSCLLFGGERFAYKRYNIIPFNTIDTLHL